MLRSRTNVASLLLGCLLLLVNCGTGSERQRLTVFAAASLTEAFTELSGPFTASHPDVDIVANFAGSQKLVAQLALGARADLLATASPADIQAALAKGVVMEGAIPFAGNGLVIIVPAGNPAAIGDPSDLARPGVRLVLADPTVPVGAYTLSFVAKFSKSDAGGSDFQERVLANVVSYEEDTKQVVAKVRLGAVDAGVVYVTDATALGLSTIAIPEQYNEKVTYWIALTSRAKAPENARSFVGYLLSREGQEILARYGFSSAE